MNKVKPVIILEGKHDLARLSKLYDADYLLTNGTSLDQKFWELLKTYQETNREFIIFTDPDGPGEYIRRKIEKIIPKIKHAYLEPKLAKAKNKVGVEHAKPEDIIKALENVVSYTNNQGNIDFKFFYSLGLVGQDSSHIKRSKLATYYRIGHGSAKTIIKKLNGIGVTQEDLIKFLKKEYP